MGIQENRKIEDTDNRNIRNTWKNGLNKNRLVFMKNVESITPH